MPHLTRRLVPSHCAENVTVTNSTPEPICGCQSQTSTQASFPFEYRDIDEPIAAAYNSLPNTGALPVMARLVAHNRLITLSFS